MLAIYLLSICYRTISIRIVLILNAGYGNCRDIVFAWFLLALGNLRWSSSSNSLDLEIECQIIQTSRAEVRAVRNVKVRR